jgi:hypothetical protein
MSAAEEYPWQEADGQYKKLHISLPVFHTGRFGLLVEVKQDSRVVRRVE